MHWMRFNDLTAEEAESFRALVEAREPARLVELARWLRLTGGPLDQLDASVDSLVTVWEWFLTFLDRGMPGVAQDARPDFCINDSAPLDPDEVPYLRSNYAGENLAHYLALVLKRLEPTSGWGVYPADRRRPNGNDNYPAIRVRDHYVIPTIFLGNMIGSAIDGRLRDRMPSRLREVVLLWLPEDLRAVPQQRGPSVLTDLPSAPEPSPRWQAPARLLVPAQTAPPEPAEVPSDGLPDSDFYLLAGPDSGVHKLRRLRPLDPAVIAQTLTQLGFVNEHETPVTADQLTSSDQELFLPGPVQLLLRTSLHRRTLRLLDVEAVDGLTSPEGRQVMATFAHLADQLGARLVTDAEREDADD